MPRRTRSRSDVITVIRSSKARPPTPVEARTVQLAPVEIDAILDAADAAHAATVAEEPAPQRLDLAAGSQRVKLPAGGSPTVALTPVEIDAVMQGAEPAAVAPDRDTRTVENVRVARGSSSLPPASGQARGPRRPRETLSADAIKTGKFTPSSRKR